MRINFPSNQHTQNSTPIENKKTKPKSLKARLSALVASIMIATANPVVAEQPVHTETKVRSVSLHHVIYANEIYEIKTLLTKENLEEKNSLDQTPLHIAAGIGRTLALKILLEAGGDPSVADRDGFTPLHFAAMNGHTEAARELINQKAPLQAKTSAGYTPLDVARINGHEEIIRILGGLGEIGRHALEANKIRQKQNNLGRTALHIAAGLGNLQELKTLLRAGANSSIADRDGFTPLHFAAMNGRTEIVRELVSQKAPLQAETSAGYTPLDVARINGHEEIIRILGGLREIGRRALEE